MSDRVGVIDIGSNSVRLVAYGAPLRAPTVLFNEKVMAGLGRDMGPDGRLDERTMADALAALARFRQLAEEMEISTLHTVATAAVRQAANGDTFLKKVRALGLSVRLLSGDEEAQAAGQGVISAFEQANGIVGDLGGGSLELVRVKDGQVHRHESFPLGVLKLAALRGKSAKRFEAKIRHFLEPGGWMATGRGLPFYLVGGSWRALAKLHMHQTHYPLPILHHYQMPVTAAARLGRAVSRIEPATLRAQGIIGGGRIPALGDAAALLSVLAKHLEPASLIVSGSGLREGLLFQGLSLETQSQDPLIVGTRAEGERQGRFAEHGDWLDTWIAPIFADDDPAMRRLRHAACLLGDIGWAANPDFRSERGLETALHGNWLGVTPEGRALIGQALWSAFGGSATRPAILNQLASPEKLDRARAWGLAIRLGQRLGAGTENPLHLSRLSNDDGRMFLTLKPAISGLAGESVERRLKNLANAMGLAPELRVV